MLREQFRISRDSEGKLTADYLLYDEVGTLVKKDTRPFILAEGETLEDWFIHATTEIKA